MDGRLELLAAGAAALNVPLAPEQLELFETYFHELVAWNQRANLTSVTGYGEVQLKHFLDSLTVCLAAKDELVDDARLIDVGSGAGLPGLPLRIAYPGLRVELADSVGKRTAFAQHLVDLLALDGVAVHTGRAEALGREPGMRESFDLVVARGLARMPLLLEYTLPFCRPGGKVVALKHGGLEEELGASERALQELRGTLCGVYPVTLAGLEDDRVVVAVEKTGPTPERYPRRTGIPAKRPL